MATAGITLEFARRAGASASEIKDAANLPWRQRRVVRHADVRSIGSRPKSLLLILEGWAARYNVRKNGSRRITGFMLAGDLCGIHAVTGSKMDHSIIALTDCVVAEITTAEMDEAVRSRSLLNRALWHFKLMEEAVLRKWLCNSVTAEQSVAHLLCEFYTRMDAIDKVDGHEFVMPITQADLGDALGITAVHVNRMVSKLQKQGLVRVSRGTVMIADVGRLQKHCDFNPAYLHLEITKA